MKTSMRTLLSLAILLAGCSLFQSVAQGQTSLDKDKNVRGSKPYVEAVRRFLDKEKPKIINGKLAGEDQYPWQVSLGVSWIADPLQAHFCGGSVYSERWIVTASHCVEEMSPSQIIVSAGTNQLVPGITRRNVRQIIMNKGWNTTTFDNDIALMELLDPLPLSFGIKPVQLLTPAMEGAIDDASRFVVVGWGATRERGNMVRDLRFLDNIPMVPRTLCNQPLGYDGRITDNMICVGFTGGEGDSCQGDSGGPLTLDTTTAPKLAGIVSWGEGCARPNKPGIYTRVANYVGWIQSCVAGSPSCHN